MTNFNPNGKPERKGLIVFGQKKPEPEENTTPPSGYPDYRDDEFPEGETPPPWMAPYGYGMPRPAETGPKPEKAPGFAGQVGQRVTNIILHEGLVDFGDVLKNKKQAQLLANQEAEQARQERKKNHPFRRVANGVTAAVVSNVAKNSPSAQAVGEGGGGIHEVAGAVTGDVIAALFGYGFRAFMDRRAKQRAEKEKRANETKGEVK